MNQLVSTFASIIVQYTTTVEAGPGQKQVERNAFIFVDGSRLTTYESRKGSRFKYSYQWMTTTNETIFRWDNTPHFPAFNTYPHHRHVGADEVAEAHQPMTLADVLAFITDQLQHSLTSD